MADQTAVSVIGGGGFGTALAVILAGAGRKVTLWKRRPAEAAELAALRENRVYLPGVPIPPAVLVTSDIRVAVEVSPYIILAVPSQFMRAVAAVVSTYLVSGQRVLSTSKGLEMKTLLRMTEVLAQTLNQLPPGGIAQLAGPCHAEEVAAGVPTAAVVAAHNPKAAEEWQGILMTPAFRIYTNPDIIGVELGGALKQIIALAAGISDGLGFGDNTKAAIITRGLAEISRLGIALGACPLTFAGLSGMGDLIATCTSRHSRNTAAGRRIGAGESAESVQAGTRMIIEGIPTCRAAVALSKRHNVEMPLTNAVYQVLFSGRRPHSLVQELMTRGAKDESAAIFADSGL